jgi:hypothetical protein
MKKPIIVTLTSIPARFPNLLAKVESLLHQTVAPEAIQIYIPKKYRRFPDASISLPKLPPGVEVIRVDEDLGPATKVLYAAKAYSDQNIDLLLCDDDRNQDPRWVERFATARYERPDDLICEEGWNIEDRLGLRRGFQEQPRAIRNPTRGKNLRYSAARALTLGLRAIHRKVYDCSGHVDVFEGYLGALVPSSAFHQDAWEIPEIVWTVDDVWLSGMAAANGVKVWLNAVSRPYLRDSKFGAVDALKNYSTRGVGRFEADRYCAELLREKYHIWS